MWLHFVEKMVSHFTHVLMIWKLHDFRKVDSSFEQKPFKRVASIALGHPRKLTLVIFVQHWKRSGAVIVLSNPILRCQLSYRGLFVKFKKMVFIISNVPILFISETCDLLFCLTERGMISFYHISKKDWSCWLLYIWGDESLPIYRVFARHYLCNNNCCYHTPPNSTSQ